MGVVDDALCKLVWINVKRVPMFSVFLDGLSLHLLQAVLFLFFEIHMTQSTASKDAENVIFGKEMVHNFTRLKGTFLFCTAGVAVIVVGGFWAVS